MPDTVQTTNLPTGRTNWTNLVDRIQHGETSGMEELYHLFAKGIRFMLCRRLGQVEADDRLHDTFLIVTAAIKRGELREPERLMGFVRTVVVRQIAAYIQIAIQKRRDERDFDLLAKTIPDRGRNAEQTFAFLERVDFMKTVLGELSERDREILSLFYLKEQTQEQICAHMNLTDTQFRLLKSRAKSRFAELGKRRLLRPRLLSAFAVSA